MKIYIVFRNGAIHSIWDEFTKAVNAESIAKNGDPTGAEYTIYMFDVNALNINSR